MKQNVEFGLINLKGSSIANHKRDYYKIMKGDTKRKKNYNMRETTSHVWIGGLAETQPQCSTSFKASANNIALGISFERRRQANLRSRLGNARAPHAHGLSSGATATGLGLQGLQGQERRKGGNPDPTPQKLITPKHVQISFLSHAVPRIASNVQN